MKFLFIFVLLLAGFGVYYFYFHTQSFVKNTPEITRQYSEQLKSDTFPLSGEFRWTFFLGPIEQVSTHTFTPEHIDYRMRGKAHSTDYRMTMLSYDANEQKWIGQMSDGLVYALFFKAIDEQHVTIYKHKCTKGLTEAIAMTRPDDDVTDDHGWNAYTKTGINEASDILPFSGTFANQDKQSIVINDIKSEWDNVTYQKLTHHLGERRWVGKNENNYLVVFYEHTSGSIDISLAIKKMTNLEKAYKIKHPNQTFVHFNKQ